MCQSAIGFGVDPRFPLHDKLMFRAYGKALSEFEQCTFRWSSMHIVQHALSPRVKPGGGGQIDQFRDAREGYDTGEVTGGSQQAGDHPNEIPER